MTYRRCLDACEGDTAGDKFSCLWRGDADECGGGDDGDDDGDDDGQYETYACVHMGGGGEVAMKKMTRCNAGCDHNDCVDVNVWAANGGEYLKCQANGGDGEGSHMHHCGERGTNNEETGQNAPDAAEAGPAYTANWDNDRCEGPWQHNYAKECDHDDSGRKEDDGAPASCTAAGLCEVLQTDLGAACPTPCAEWIWQEGQHCMQWMVDNGTMMQETRDGYEARCPHVRRRRLHKPILRRKPSRR